MYIIIVSRIVYLYFYLLTDLRSQSVSPIPIYDIIFYKQTFDAFSPARKEFFAISFSRFSTTDIAAVYMGRARVFIFAFVFIFCNDIT